MLDQHLIAKTRPLAKAENVVLWEQYRITVLQDRLFRIEECPEKRFSDEATQIVWFRDMPAQDYKVRESCGRLEIETPACVLIVAKERQKCRIRFGKTEVPLDNEGNLLGTARTLDGYSGNTFKGFHNVTDGDAVEDQKLELSVGVCSKRGVAVLEDSDSLLLGQDGRLRASDSHRKDEYIFAYGEDYRGAVKALYLICGMPPMIPRYALGNWWSRYYPYTEKEYLRLLNSFEEEEIPLTVATIDMDWHYSKNVDEEFHITERGRNTEYCGGNNGWTGYSWNKNLFPDYPGFLKKIQNKNLKITLNLHPADGIRWWEDCYEKMAEVMGVDTENGEQVAFDIADPKFVNAYFSIIHKPYEEDGVTFWWIDWQQGKTTKVEGLDPLWALNHYHYLDHKKNHEQALILSRYAGLGSHRYPLGFSGDTHISWDTLDYLPYFTATASNAGYTWWSHDIGGHMYGEKEDEMYLRHVQYGVFSPINRLHCTNAKVCTKEPWAYGNGTGELAKKALRFRHRLIPYLYSASYVTHTEGRALTEPLYYEWKDEKAYNCPNAYFFGTELLVAPVTQRREADGFARVSFWLGRGKWTDIFTGAEYDGGDVGKEFQVYRQLESIPVLAREGAILPLSGEKGNLVLNPTNMEIWVYKGTHSYTLYEDGAEEGKEGSCQTEFVTRYSEQEGTFTQCLDISITGEEGIIPEGRTLKIKFKNIPEGTIQVYHHGAPVPAEEVLTDCTAVVIPVKAGDRYRIEVTGQSVMRLQKLKEQGRKVLISSEGNLKARNDFLKQMLAAETVEAFEETVLQSDKISEITKKCLTETL